MRMHLVAALLPSARKRAVLVRQTVLAGDAKQALTKVAQAYEQRGGDTEVAVFHLKEFNEDEVFYEEHSHQKLSHQQAKAFAEATPISIGFSPEKYQ